MKGLLKLEEAAITVAALYLLSLYTLGLPVWLWCVLFFAPDLSMVGYVWNTRYGARLYNLFHHKGVAIGVALVGYVLSREGLIAAGLVLLAHASFDRMLGYGLKYKTGFKDTHLGTLAQPAAGVTAQ